MKDGLIMGNVKKVHMIVAVLLVVSVLFFAIKMNSHDDVKTYREHAMKTTDAQVAKDLNLLAKTVSAEVGPKKIQVKLERVYLDGEISEEIIEETIWSMEDFWAFYDDWSLVDQDEQQIHFQIQVDDISPLLKINGYFGISDEGILNIYDGKPEQKKIIHSFYQINLEKLKSHHEHKLKEGIPVTSTENYREILQLYKQYEQSET